MVRNQLMRNRVDLIVGHGRFIDPTITWRTRPAGKTTVTGDYIMSPLAQAGTAIESGDEERVLDSDGILDLKSLSILSMVVVSAGVIGIEYASMFAALNPKSPSWRSGTTCWTSATPGRRGAEIPSARPGGDIPVRRGSDRGRWRHLRAP